MELGKQIKKHRINMNLSQEELAEKIYVTRQTISNWENDKNYPDVHSLLLLSMLFHISLDQLIKGDIEMMKEEINKEELQKFNHDSVIFAFLLLFFIVSLVPLYAFFSYYGLAFSVLIYIAGMYYALKLEKFKKAHDIQTFKEIVAFTEGKRLDELEKARESGKRPYQKVLAALIAGSIAFVILMLSVWLLKSFLF